MPNAAPNRERVLRAATAAFTLDGYRASIDRIALRAVRQAEGIRIQVEDAGFGMTELQRTSALAATLTANPSQADPYKARPKGGAGLGLAICRRLIEQHNGRLEIESQTGHGSTVNVVLPAA